MNIKEVKEKTKLSEKTIRYYEDKGLLEVRRGDNNYRIYEDKDIDLLLRIKLLRYMDYSIEDIKQLDLSDDQCIQESLYKHACDMHKYNEQYKEKEELCLKLSKEYHSMDIKEYIDMIDFNESEEYKEFKEVVHEYESLSTLQFSIQCLICLGPILSLFINIYLKNTGALMLNSVLALIAAVFLTVFIQSYVKTYRLNKYRIKEKNKKSMILIPILILTLAGAFSLFYLIHCIYEYIFLPEDYLFYETSQISMMIILFLSIILSGIISSVLCCKIFRYNYNDIESMNDFIVLYKSLGKYKGIFIILCIVLIMVLMCDVSVVTKEYIIDYSLMHITGKVYNYSDVEKIETGFGTKSFALAEYKKKGNFYYKLYLDDNMIVFSQPTVNEDIKEYEDTYIELEYFDQELMNLGIEKTGSIQGYENVMMDEVYVERFKRIINNKTR